MPFDGPAADRLLAELASAVLDQVRAEMRESPPRTPPRPLVPLLSHRKLTAKARRTVRDTLDSDDELRARVAEALDDGAVGQAGVLFARRPDGWEQKLSDLVADAASSDIDEAGAREERRAAKRLVHAEKARDRAQEEARAAANAAEQTKADLASERQRRRVVEERLARLERRVENVEGERDAARRRIDELTEALEIAQRDRDEAWAQRAAEVAVSSVEREDTPGNSMRPNGLELEGSDSDPSFEASDSEAVEEDRQLVLAKVEAEAEVRRRLTGGAVAAAAQAAGELARALAEAAAALTEDGDLAGQSLDPSSELSPSPNLGTNPNPGPEPASEEPILASSTGWSRGHRRTLPRHQRRRSSAQRRRPIPMRAGMVDDGPEAANYLLRVPGVVVLVDGYNTTVTAWGDQPLPEQRRRLLGALEPLAMRTGATIEVVFDGAELAETAVGTAPRRPVRAWFSAPDVEADDELIERVHALPSTVPVVVVSNDNRVRDGSRSGGANVLSVEQLVDILYIPG